MFAAPNFGLCLDDATANPGDFKNCTRGDSWRYDDAEPIPGEVQCQSRS